MAEDKQAVKSPDLHHKPPKAEVSYVHSDPPTTTELRHCKGNFSWLKAGWNLAQPIFLPFSIFTATVTASLGRSLSIPTASAITTCPKQPSPRGLPSVSLEVLNRGLTHSIWGRGTASTIPELNIKGFQQLTAALSNYHMELMKCTACVGFHAHHGLFSQWHHSEHLIPADQLLNPAFKLPFCL